MTGMGVGEGCRYYRNGWRYGVIREAPKRGRRKGFVRVENPTPVYKQGEVTRRVEWVAVANLDPEYAPQTTAQFILGPVR